MRGRFVRPKVCPSYAGSSSRHCSLVTHGPGGSIATETLNWLAFALEGDVEAIGVVADRPAQQGDQVRGRARPAREHVDRVGVDPVVIVARALLLERVLERGQLRLGDSADLAA